MHTYLALDRGIFEGHHMRNVVLRVRKLTKDKENNPLFTQDYFGIPPKKWEVRYDNGYPNVIYDEKEGVYRCYYTLIIQDEAAERELLKADNKESEVYGTETGRITSLAYAQSVDGIHWEKPDLGIVEFGGNRENNLLLRFAHGTGVFLDQDESVPDRRYKLVTKVEYPTGQNYMAVGFSGDGIHFGDLIPWPEFNPPGDAHNYPFYDRKTGKYRLITRIWKNGVRIVAGCESQDFVNWSEPVEILRGRGFEDQMYSMPVFPLDDIYLGLASVYHEGDQLDENYDTVDVELMFSTDLKVFDSVGAEDYLLERGEGEYPDGEFDCGCIYMSPPVKIGSRLYFYYMGGNGKHTGHRRTSLARAWTEEERMAYYTTKREGIPARLSTYNFSILGSDLMINAEIETNGWIRVGLGRRDGRDYPGFEAENCSLVPVGEERYLVRFPGHKLEELGSLPVSLHITMEKAKLYTIGGDLEIMGLKY